MNRMKVYGCTLWIHNGPAEPNGNRQRRCVVAARNQRSAAEAMFISLNYLREHGGETGNAEEQAVALAEPGVVFWEHKGQWSPRDRPTAE